MDIFENLNSLSNIVSAILVIYFFDASKSIVRSGFKYFFKETGKKVIDDGVNTFKQKIITSEEMKKMLDDSQHKLLNSEAMKALLIQSKTETLADYAKLVREEITIKAAELITPINKDIKSINKDIKLLKKITQFLKKENIEIKDNLEKASNSRHKSKGTVEAVLYQVLESNAQVLEKLKELDIDTKHSNTIKKTQDFIHENLTNGKY